MYPPCGFYSVSAENDLWKIVLLTLTPSMGITTYIFHEDQTYNTRERPSVNFVQLLYISET